METAEIATPVSVENHSSSRGSKSDSRQSKKCSKIPLYTGKSTSGSNVDELPEAIRMEHRQHCESKHQNGFARSQTTNFPPQQRRQDIHAQGSSNSNPDLNSSTNVRSDAQQSRYPNPRQNWQRSNRPNNNNNNNNGQRYSNSQQNDHNAQNNETTDPQTPTRNRNRNRRGGPRNRGQSNAHETTPNGQAAPTEEGESSPAPNAGQARRGNRPQNPRNRGPNREMTPNGSSTPGQESESTTTPNGGQARRGNRGQNPRNRGGPNREMTPNGPSTPGQEGESTTTPSGGQARRGNRPQNGRNRGGGPNSENGKKTFFYTDYLPLCDLQKALKKGEVVEGILRINPKNYRDSYISTTEEGLDILISGMVDRNRSLNGDKVALSLHPVEKWMIHYNVLDARWSEWKDAFVDVLLGKSIGNLSLKDLKLNHGQNRVLQQSSANDIGAALSAEFPSLPTEVFVLTVAEFQTLPFWREFVQRTAKVVGIFEENHSRITGGTIDAKSTEFFYVVKPSDSRMPNIFLSKANFPANFATTFNPDQLYLVKITRWGVNDQSPQGQIYKDLGYRGEIQAEIELILQSNVIDTEPFPENILQGTGFESPEWKIPEDELSYRRDFRKHCLFTIDPSTAKDLDDAISLKSLGNDQYEVGVHIADVSYFIREATILDQIASKRATSVYLPDRVIPMLPHQFCQNLCSLNPGEDKLAFSAVFTMTADGVVVGEPWIGRTVINSCSKLSYEHAQKLIDNEPFEPDQFPKIFHDWEVANLGQSVQILNVMAKNIRERRFQTGSVQIEKSKLAFVLDDAQYPIGMFKYVFHDSNRLIEELMLLANRTIAKFLYDRFASEKRAYLRMHPPPDKKVMGRFIQQCQTVGVNFDTSTSLSIHNSLQIADNDMRQWISFQLVRAMKLAKYHVVQANDKPQTYMHYALNFQYYTHFTSPIRRYADLIVHRLLSEAMDYVGACTSTQDQLWAFADNCNTRKQSAFVVSEESAKVFLKAYLERDESFTTTGMVCAISDTTIEFLLLQFDIPVQVFLRDLQLDAKVSTKNAAFRSLNLTWKNQEGENLPDSSLKQELRVTDKLPVSLRVSEKFEILATIQHPNGQFHWTQGSKKPSPRKEPLPQEPSQETLIVSN